MFFVFLGACRCLVHLVACFFGDYFWCLSMFCEVRVTKPAQAPKKTKKTNHQMHQTCAGTKKNKKKLRFPGSMGPLLSSCWIFFWCFWCLSMFFQHIILAPPYRCRDALRCPYSPLAESQVVAVGHPNTTLGLTSYAMTIHHS